MDELLEINGVRLRVIAEGQGVPLLLFNGGPGCDDYLAPLSEMVSDVCRVIRFEPRGCGRSDWSGPYDVATTLADAEAIRAALGVEHLIAGGHSFGVNLALAYALAYRKRTRGVIGVAGGNILNDRECSEEFHRRLDAEGEDTGGISFRADPRVNSEGNQSWRQYIKQPGLLRALAELNIPCHLINAGNDVRLNWPTRQLAALLPRGEYAEIAGAGHFIWLQHAVQLRELLRRAVEQIVRDSESGHAA